MMLVSDSHVGFHGRTGSFTGNPVEILYFEICGHQIFVITKYHLIVFNINASYVHRLFESQSQAFTLAYSVVDDPLMGTQNISLLIYEISGRIVLSSMSADETGIVSIRNKTDILTVVFFLRL